MSSEELLRIGEREFAILDRCSPAPSPAGVQKVRTVRGGKVISVDLIGHHGESLWETEYRVYNDNNASVRADSLTAFLGSRYACPVETSRPVQ